MTRVDRTKRPSENWEALAESVNDTGASVKDLAQKNVELETEPFNPAKSIDVRHTLDGS